MFRHLEWPDEFEVEQVSSVFKAYDIRGIAYDELDERFAERLGKALGTFLDASNIAVGRDIRESSPSLHSLF